MSFRSLAALSFVGLVALPSSVGCSASSDDGVGGLGGGNTGGGNSGGFGAFGTGGSNTGGFGAIGSGGTTNTGGTVATGGAAGASGSAGASGGAAGTSGTGGATGGTGGATGGTGGATGGTGGATGGTGGATGGTGGATGGTGGATGGTGGATGGTGGGGTGCTGTSVAGVNIGGTCFFMANKSGLQHAAAKSACTSLGAGWDLCPNAKLCNPAVFTYLGTAGCNCNGGNTACACGTTNNLYIHVSDNPSAPYYIRTSNVPNCDWSSDACTDSVSETCGAALCCR